MTALTIAFITFVCAFGAAMIGAYSRDRLPEVHVSKESQDTVRLSMGLIGTMSAVLLGIVTASARSTFDVQEKAVRDSAVTILTLDRQLCAVRRGDETDPRSAAKHRRIPG